jgi:hypothetical protein
MLDARPLFALSKLLIRLNSLLVSINLVLWHHALPLLNGHRILHVRGGRFIRHLGSAISDLLRFPLHAELFTSRASADAAVKKLCAALGCLSLLRVVPSLRRLCVPVQLRPFAPAKTPSLHDAVQNCSAQDAGTNEPEP